MGNDFSCAFKIVSANLLRMRATRAWRSWLASPFKSITAKPREKHHIKKRELNILYTVSLTENKYKV